MVGDIRTMLPLGGTAALAANTLLPAADTDASRSQRSFTTLGTSSTPTHVSGVRGNGLSFDGNDYICGGTVAGTCARAADFSFPTGTNTDFAMGVWVKFATQGATANIASTYDGTSGQYVRIYYTTTPTNYVEGTIISFLGSSCNVSVDWANGSGTYTSWTFLNAGLLNSAVDNTCNV